MAQEEARSRFYAAMNGFKSEISTCRAEHQACPDNRCIPSHACDIVEYSELKFASRIIRADACLIGRIHEIANPENKNA